MRAAIDLAGSGAPSWELYPASESCLQPIVRQRRHDIAISAGHVGIGDECVEDGLLNRLDGGIEEGIDIDIRDGDQGRQATGTAGRDETKYLEAIDRLVESGKTAAEELLERFAGKWGGSVDPVFEDYAY